MRTAPRTRVQLTARAVCSGMLFGGVLSLCNIYSGLKVGFTTNMSIASALLGYASFSLSHRLFGTRPLNLEENTMQQTAASAAASIAGAGLVSAIPALTMLTGTTLPYRWLVAWVLNVSLLGVIVGFTLRHELIVASGLPFPYGQATCWALALCGAASVALQQWLFDIPAWVAIAAVALSFGLAIVAGRVTGETGIAPIGAMGKITQLAFAVISPANPTTNLMAANVTGGAASQCADMLHDLKTGHLVGARPEQQALAQVFGVLAGAVCGSSCYLLLIPDPEAQLISDVWPAPAVAQWKAVAELFTRGISHIAPFSVWSALAAALLGVALSILDQTLSLPRRRYVPSATSMGLAFVLPAYFALSMALGAVLAAAYLRRAGASGGRLVNTLASGVVAGESLAGVAAAVVRVL